MAQLSGGSSASQVVFSVEQTQGHLLAGVTIDSALSSLFQQDVSEFTHKLLDWLEDAFQLTVNVT